MASTDDTTGTIDPRWARVRPLVFRTIIGAVVAAGLIGIVAVLLGDFGRVAVQLLLTIVVVVVFALLSWYDADVSSRRSGTFAFVSIAVSMYLLVTGLTKVWVVPRDPYGGDGVWIVGERFWQWLGIVFVARFALLHVHLLLVIHRRYPTPVLQLVAKVTVGVIALLALLLSVPLLAPDADLARGYWRLVWVVVILDLLGTVVVPLSNALFRPRHGDDRRPASAATTAATWAQPVGVARPGAPVPTAPVSWADTPAPGTAVAVPPTTGGEERAAGSTVTASDGLVYERRPEQARALAWPRYVDGTPLPAAADGSPDFSGVARS